jgi:hypothetical protein
MSQDTPNIRQEAHVQHAIGFVENQELEPGQARCGPT